MTTLRRHVRHMPQPFVGSPRHALRRSIMMHPGLYLPLARWKRAESALDDETEFVLDGLERSANTFAAVAFQLAQNAHVRMAHHMHAAAPLIEAAHRGLPTLITAREPESTIVSSAMRQPRVTLRQWLKTYAAFYERLAPVRHRFMVATFEDVTSDFGAVIRRVNERFDTRFVEFEHSADRVRAVFVLIDERAEGPPWQPSFNRFLSGFTSADEYFEATRAFRGADDDGRNAVLEHRVGRPSPAREAGKPAMRERYYASELARLRARAESAYEAFVA
jgi:hypothetical protein